MSKKSRQFWVVWNDRQYPPTRKHWTLEEAQDEAERLARNNPGEWFYILKASEYRMAEKPPVTTYILTESEQ